MLLLKTLMIANRALLDQIHNQNECSEQLSMITYCTKKIIAQTLSMRYAYISKRALDQIEKAHGKTAFQRAMMYAKQAKHIAKEGFFTFKKDLDEYFKLTMLEKVEKKTLTQQQLAFKSRVLKDMGRFKPIILINILPFSAPLLIFYILTYPTKVPSYFCLDELYELHQKQSIQKQQEAIQIFKKKPIDPANFNLATSSLDQLKLLSQLLFGHFEDGVVGINKYFKNNPKAYLLHPHFSKHLVIRSIKQELKKDIEANKELQGLTTEEVVLWKYTRVMSGEDFIVFRPIQNPEHLLNLESLAAEKKQDPAQSASQGHPHHRHSHSHTPHQHIHKTVEHQRQPHKSQTRKNK